MSKRTKLTLEDISEIIRLYQTTIPSTHKLAEHFSVGHKKISNILIDNGIIINKRGAQPNGGRIVTLQKFMDKNNVPDTDGNKYIAVCKSTGKEFNDHTNKSGALNKHLKNIYPNLEIPSSYIRRSYIERNGKFWHEQYFDIIEVNEKNKRHCKLCNWTTVDIDNKTGCFENHIKDLHGLDLSEYLDKYPEDLKYHNKYIEQLNRIETFSDAENFVICNLCNTKFKTITNTHLQQKHGITQFDYKLMFPNSKLLSDSSQHMFSENACKANINIKPTWTSKGEIEVKDYIESLGISVEKSRNRHLLQGKEIDIILPEYKIGIEYNGLYWHTEKKGKNTTYHLEKTKACNEVGYKLIHIFEDEWVNKTNIVKLKLSHILGHTNAIKIGGRQCTVKYIDNKTKNKFLNETHIQGSDKANICIGAYFKETLVGVMSFIGERNMTTDNSSSYELSRFSTNSNYIISGLASKLICFFIKEYKPSSIISFADRRWTMDAHSNMYTKIGFKLVSVLKPSYTYFNSKVGRTKRFHKFGFGKSSLKKKYPHLDFNKTEKELTTELGYDRIWDCGLFKYQMVL